ncbi:MAG: hypothetical protein AAF546_14470, partial [Verrucomicrobiota bacterium]
MKIKIRDIRPSTIILATLIVKLSLDTWAYSNLIQPTDFLTERELREFLGTGRLLDLLYYIPMMGLYLYSKKNAYRACNAFFLIHIYLCFYIFLQPFDGSSMYGALLLIMSYLANLQAHRFRRLRLL